jgi:hypothetical protein
MMEKMQTKSMADQLPPNNMALLMTDFTTRTGQDLRMVDQRNAIETPSDILGRFEHFSRTFDFGTLQESRTVGIILCYGQQHAIPVLITDHDNTKFMLIFDAAPNARITDYWNVAKLFSDYGVLLNTTHQPHTRTQSCVTDACEVLCRAFRTNGLIEKVIEKIGMPDESKNSETSLLTTHHVGLNNQPENFSLFKMPEELCRHTQKPSF